MNHCSRRWCFSISMSSGRSAKQLVAKLEVEVLVIDAPVEVEREPADIHVIALLVQHLAAIDVVDDAVGRLGRCQDGEVVDQGMRLQRGCRGVCARPDHELGAIVGQAFPDLGEIGVETDCHADLAEIGIEDRRLGADLDQRLPARARPSRDRPCRRCRRLCRSRSISTAELTRLLPSRRSNGQTIQVPWRRAMSDIAVMIGPSTVSGRLRFWPGPGFRQGDQVGPFLRLSLDDIDDRFERTAAETDAGDAHRAARQVVGHLEIPSR